MKSAIEDILFGERTSNEIPLSERGRAILDKVAESEDAFRKTVEKGEGTALFERYTDAVNEMHCEECTAYYKVGFRFGFRLALDIFLGDCAENGKK